MAPIVLKLSNDSNMLNELNGDDTDELEKTWRVCTKAKQALEHGSRLENRSWRRWFLSVQKHMKQQQKTPAVSLEIQYKRNLLSHQRKQYQQLLIAASMNSGTLATTIKPPTFVDNQYQQPPLAHQALYSSTTITNSDSTNGNNRMTCCAGNPFRLSATSNSHPAMYVASDEPNSLAVQQNTLQYRFEPPHQPPLIPYPAIITSSTLSSFASSSPTRQPSINNRPKTQKHRLRRPLPVMNAGGTDKTACDDCGTTFTPLWRRYRHKTLCNACGLYWKLHNSPRPGHLIPSMTQRSHHPEHGSNSDSTLTDHQNELPQCSNCGTNQTTLWRRSELDGSPLCNACGLYAKLHQETRPLSMKTNVIKRRQRLY